MHVQLQERGRGRRGVVPLEGREVAPVSVGVAVAAHIIIQLGRSLTPTPVPVPENLSMPNRRRTTVHPDDSTALTRREFIERSAALAAGLAILDACGRPRIEPMSPGGAARFSSAGDELTLANDVLSVTWSASSGGCEPKYCKRSCQPETRRVRKPKTRPTNGAQGEGGHTTGA